MRYDALGLFWDDVDYKTEKKQTLLLEEGWEQVFPGFWAMSSELKKGLDPRTVCHTLDNAYAIARKNKTGEKRQPPEPVWLAEDYLPGLEEAREFNVPLMSDDELLKLSFEKFSKQQKHPLIFDIECYGNYFLIAFMSAVTKKVIYFEISDEQTLDIPKLQWLTENFCLIGFNSRNYDIPITAMALHGCSTAMMKSATSMIINEGQRPWHVLRHYKVKPLDYCDHIDLMEVAPLFASLKLYGGRMHSRKLQDLPFHPDSVLSEPQRAITRHYCVNDLTTTFDLWQELKEEVELREKMSQEYVADLRSKSDAQIAEAVIGKKLEELHGHQIYPPKIDPGSIFQYYPPPFLQFSSPLMQDVFSKVCSAAFEVSEYGNIGLPQELKDLSIKIGETVYKMGIGGLHSTEKKAAHYSDKFYTLYDKDVVSYYPKIILNLGLYPEHLGPRFLMVYRSIVERRITAKRNGDSKVAKTLKIVINGSFGKFGNQYSILYSPQLLIQVTLTGQLSLLQLIETLELVGIPVVSANTDGLVIKCPKGREQEMESLVANWEAATGFETEEVIYDALFSRDVNNYLAIKHHKDWKEEDTLDDKVKTKGIFAASGLSKNPQNEICILAIKEYLLHRTPIETTIRTCKDITKFVSVRTVKGGAVKLKGDVINYLGKAIRWYYAVGEEGEIVYAKSGNRVPRSDGAKPLMELPTEFPSDVDYEWYEKETVKLLKQIQIEY